MKGASGIEKRREEAYRRWLETDDDCDCPTIYTEDDTTETFAQKLVDILINVKTLGHQQVVDKMLALLNLKESDGGNEKSSVNEKGAFALEIDKHYNKMKNAENTQVEIIKLESIVESEKGLTDVDDYIKEIDQINEDRYKMVLGFDLYNNPDKTSISVSKENIWEELLKIKKELQEREEKFCKTKDRDLVHEARGQSGLR